MKSYKVISPFHKRDEGGNPLPGYASPGDEIELSDKEAKRLMVAQCVVPVEDRMVSPEQNRKRGRPRKHDPNAG